MLPVVLVFGGIAVILALASNANARAGDGRKSPSQPPPAGPPRLDTCSADDRAFVEATARAIASGNATLALVNRAMPIAVRCYPATATAFKAFVKKKTEEAAKKAIPELIRKPDRPSAPIPQADGKTLWFFDKNGVARPRFPSVLVTFQGLQDAIGAKSDGRIGPKTLAAFVKRMKSLGFKKYPTTVPALAANVVKYTEIITKGYQPAQVGRSHGQAPFAEASPERWAAFVRRMRQAPADELSEKGRLGMFGENARRLEQLGLMSDVKLREVWLDSEAEHGKCMYMGRFVPFELADFLSNPALQYRVFAANMKDYRKRILSDDKLNKLLGAPINGEPLTLSGLLGLAHQAGLKGARQWVRKPKQRERFPHTTEVFHATNGIF